MSEDVTPSELAQLRALIHYHNRCYYEDDAPVISDAEYDELFRQLLLIEEAHPEWMTSDSPSQRVGSTDTVAVFQKYVHRTPMLSLQNVFNDEELSQFHKRLTALVGSDQLQYAAEPKFDGLAVSLHYQDRLLVRMVTRGDGYTGEDVTRNIGLVHHVPRQLPMTFPAVSEVRGEVLMLKADFEALNHRRLAQGKKCFANPRNAAAGTVRQLLMADEEKRRLHFFAYAYLTPETTGGQEKTHSEEMKYLESAGFVLSDVRAGSLSFPELIDFYESVQERRAHLPFDIDGVVFKLEQRALQEKAGFVARAPRFAVAYKFAASSMRTRLQTIKWQIGRTGLLTPVAVLSPVVVGGVTVTHASLHNYKELLRKDVRVGDMVWVRRAGDVIPEIVAVAEPALPRADQLLLPVHCPSCHSALIQEDDEGRTVRCYAGYQCPAQHHQRLVHFCSRDAMNIEGLGEQSLALFIQHGLLNNLIDIYQLSIEDIAVLPGFGETSAKKLLMHIETSKRVSLERFIYAIGINLVGKKIARILAQQIDSIESFEAFTEESLCHIPEIGPLIAQSITTFWRDHHEMVMRLIEEAPLTLLSIKENDQIKQEGRLSGYRFLITGRFEEMTREELIALIHQHGGEVLSSLSTKVHYLLAGDKVGKKHEKAQKMNITILTKESFLALLSSNEEEKKVLSDSTRNL